MRSLLLLSLCAVSFTAIGATVDEVVIDEKPYEIHTMLHRDLGPGVDYTRYRLPLYPLNVNVITVDLTNPNNRIEEMQGYDQVCRTEALANAQARYSTPEKRALGGANANFWCVSGQQPWSDLLIGAPFGGTVRNGEIVTETNFHADQWAGGPTLTGVCALTEDRTPILESMYWRGYLGNDATGPLEIQQVNRVVRDGEIGYYNHYYGRDKKFQPVDQYYTVSTPHWQIAEGSATEVYLTIDEGQDQTPGGEYICTVQEVRDNAGTGTLGDYDIAIVARRHRDVLSTLKPGDKLGFNHGWTSFATGEHPKITQMVTTLATVMTDGVISERDNYQVDYNSMIYSRTGYGSSADRKTFYMIVIDKSTDPVYGTSAGCPTAVMCQIARHLGCMNLGTCDAGGSAQLLVGERVVNKTTESNPRAIANGMIVYSIAPDDAEIARLEFDDVTLTAPIYSASAPRVLGYNQYGDLIDDNVQGIEYTCTPEVGTCSDGRFFAGAIPTTGTLTAHYGSITVSKTIEVVPADIAIKLRDIIIDTKREYAMEVCAMIGDTEFIYDPAIIEWATDDSDVAYVDADGVLHGVSNGYTTITASIGDFSDGVGIYVEMPPQATLELSEWNLWTVKGQSGISNVNLSDEGLLTFSYGSPRDPSVQLNRQTKLYGLPDALTLRFTPDVAIESVSLDLRSRSHSRNNFVTVTPQTPYPAGITAEVTFPIEEVGDLAYIGTYPLTLHSLKFTTTKDGANKGEHSIAIEPLTAHYENYSDGVEAIQADDKPRRDGSVYDLTGRRLGSSLNNLAPGIYIRSGRKIKI